MNELIAKLTTHSLSSVPADGRECICASQQLQLCGVEHGARPQIMQVGEGSHGARFLNAPDRFTLHSRDDIEQEANSSCWAFVTAG